VEDDVKDDFVKRLAFAMTVEVPVSGVEVEFDGAVVGFAIDLNGGV